MARMPAYVISEVEVLDEQLADEYRTLAEASIRLYGGRYIVRGAMPEAVEIRKTALERRLLFADGVPE